MNINKLIGLCKELRFSGKALQAWIDKERDREREESALRLEAAKEDYERALQRQGGQHQLLELRLRVQEWQQTSQVVPTEPTERDTRNQGFRSLRKLIPAFNKTRDKLDAHISEV